jgi:hypothetical protein
MSVVQKVVCKENRIPEKKLGEFFMQKVNINEYNNNEIACSPHGVS